MLDLFISYINFIILTIRYLVKIILFQPPKEKGYKVIKNSDGKIEIYIKTKNYKNYHKIKKRVQLNIEFHKIQDNDKDCKNNYIPFFIFKPTLSLHKACIIFCHGNSCDIGSTFNECCDLAKLTKCIVINFDYPGYGIYDNVEPNEKKTYRSLRVIYQYVREKLNFEENSIIVYGFSLGTGVAFDLACNKDYKFAGLILQAPFLSIFRTMYNTKKTKYFDYFNNCDKVKFLNIKTLFIHGNQDQIVPYIHGRILSKIIPQNKLYSFQTINGAGHNDIFTPKYLPVLGEIINDFIENVSPYSIKNKENQTVRNKELDTINKSIIDNKNLNNNNQNNNSFSKFISGYNKYNTTFNNESRKVNEIEIENRSFSENNSAFFNRKKDSILDILRTTKYCDESHLIKTMYDERGFDSEDKLIRTDKRQSKKYNTNINISKEINSNNIIDKSQNNFINKGEKNSNFDNVKSLNVSLSSETQREDYSNNISEFNFFGKKGNKISLQKIINISKNE